MSGENIDITGFFINGLVLVFIALKLSGVGVVANWSWWIVFSPYLACLAIAAVCFLIIFILKGVGK